MKGQLSSNATTKPNCCHCVDDDNEFGDDTMTDDLSFFRCVLCVFAPPSVCRSTVTCKGNHESRVTRLLCVHQIKKKKVVPLFLLLLTSTTCISSSHHDGGREKQLSGQSHQLQREELITRQRQGCQQQAASKTRSAG